MKINAITIDGEDYSVADGTLTKVDAPPPVNEHGVLLFSDDFRTMPNLNGFNTTQITNGGKVYLVIGSHLECVAPVGAKAEIGHDWDIAADLIKSGRVWTFEGEFELMAGGPSEIFILDVESTEADSEAGPRLRRKNGGWGIEQDKFNGQNIQPSNPPIPTFAVGTRYSILWQSKFHQTEGWHKLIVNGRKVFDTDVEGKRGKTGPVEDLNRFRWGVTINSSSASATMRWYRAAAWVK